MRNAMKRRDFIRTGAVAGAAALAGGLKGQRALDAGVPRVARPDLAVVTGAEPLPRREQRPRGPRRHEGIRPAGLEGGLLINAPSWWRRPGSHTHPDLTLAVILASFKAGAKEIHYLIDPLADYWKRSTRAANFAKETGAVRKCSASYVEKEIAGAKALKKSSVVREFLDCDVFINLPIIKHHVGVGMSCNLKNLMGVNTNASNQFFHSRSLCCLLRTVSPRAGH